MICNLATGQQVPLYSQYLYNKFLINPAVAGSDGYTSFNLTAREQWVGYSGAPRTFSFSGQWRILKRSYILKHTSARRTIYRPATDGRVGLGGFNLQQQERPGSAYRFPGFLCISPVAEKSDPAVDGTCFHRLSFQN